MARSKKPNNVKIAGLFVLFVLALIVISSLIKIIFIFRDSNFDGKNAFNVVVLSEESTNVISFSPPTRSISILNLDKKMDMDSASKTLKVPVDGEVLSKETATKNNLSSIFFKSILSLGNSYRQMNFADILRLFLYTRGVMPSSIYYREISNDFNEQQKSTLISLTFTDPAIYEENQSIEIVNATNVYGQGGRLASLITNIGGNVILVTSVEKGEGKSKIIYSGDKTYTVTRLAQILNYPIVKTDKKSISDVIIIIGEDNKEGNF